MDIIMTAMIVPTLLMVLLPIALLIVLQVWLCKKGRWLGLILPGISLILSLLMTFSLTVFTRVTTGGGAVRVTDEAGQVIQEIPVQEASTTQQFVMDRGGVIAAVSVFLAANIPTVVYGGIWLHYKGRRDTLEAVKRMRIEDLE